jgi:hypothetical protein
MDPYNYIVEIEGKTSTRSAILDILNQDFFHIPELECDNIKSLCRMLHVANLLYVQCMGDYIADRIEITKIINIL